MKKILFLLSICCISLLNSVEAQKAFKCKAMKMPLDYMYPTNESTVKFDGEDNSSKKNKDKVWVVFSDRENNQTFENPDDKNLKPFKKLKFKEHFFVVDTKKNWIRIVSSPRTGKNDEVENAIDCGWIHKDQMLLWSKGIKHAQTSINEKALILHTISSIPKGIVGDGKTVDFYDSPGNGAKLLGKNPLYDFYFVYKVVGSKLLLGQDVEIEDVDKAGSDLIGWFDKSQIVEWNTRMTLEPNFLDEAFKERKEKENLRVKVYLKRDDADIHVLNGAPPISRNGSIIWDEDPVVVSKKRLGDTINRFKGAIVRPPVLSCEGDLFRTGIAGSSGNFDPELFAKVQRRLDNRRQVDVLFVIEATRYTAEYKNYITQTIDEVDKKFSEISGIRYGAALYRTYGEYNSKDLPVFASVVMQNEIEPIKSFISNSTFASNPQKQYTAMYYGIQQGLINCGVDKERSVILVVLGANADMRASDGENTDLSLANGTNLIPKKDKFLSTLVDYDPFIIGIQCKHPNTQSGSSFKRQIANIGLDYAKRQYDGLNNNRKSIGVNPDMPEWKEEGSISLTGGTTKVELLRAKESEALSTTELNAFLTNSLESIYNEWKLRIEGLEKAARGNVVDEFGHAIGSFSKEVIDELRKMGLTDAQIEKLREQQYNFFVEGYAPKKIIAGATYEPFDIVLFMTQEDLYSYIETLKQVCNAKSYSMDKRREFLKSFYMEQLRQVLGGDKNSCDKNIEDLIKLQNGITNCTDIGNKQGFFTCKICEIDKESKCADLAINSAVENACSKLSKLENIYKLGVNYEFAYKSRSSKQVYFWIPLNDTY
jgi:hypothetical protein